VRAGYAAALRGQLEWSAQGSGIRAFLSERKLFKYRHIRQDHGDWTMEGFRERRLQHEKLSTSEYDIAAIARRQSDTTITEALPEYQGL
jgi:hypothetical protein